jgi:hypothetical protein
MVTSPTQSPFGSQDELRGTRSCSFGSDPSSGHGRVACESVSSPAQWLLDVARSFAIECILVDLKEGTS